MAGPQALSASVVKLAAATLGGGVRVAEREGLAQAVLAEVDHGAVHQGQALGVDVDLHALLLEHRVALALFAGQVGHVTPAGAAGLGHAETQAQRAGGLGDERCTRSKAMGSG